MWYVHEEVNRGSSRPLLVASGILSWICPLVLQHTWLAPESPGNVKVRDGSGTGCGYTNLMISRVL